MQLDDLRAIMSECAGTSGAELTPLTQYNSFQELGYDSLAVIAARAYIRHRHDVTIPDEVADTLTTPSDLLRAVGELSAARETA